MWNCGHFYNKSSCNRYIGCLLLTKNSLCNKSSHHEISVKSGFSMHPPISFSLQIT